MKMTEDEIMKELHRIRFQIHDETKDLTPDELEARSKRLADRAARELGLKIIMPSEVRK